MTMFAPILFRCDAYATDSRSVASCPVTLSTFIEQRPAARRLAKDSGWLHVAGFDFCAEPERTPLGRSHAQMVSGHRPVFAHSVDHLRDLDYYTSGTWSVRCRCAWEASVDTVHTAVMPSNGMMVDKDRAARVWLQAHIRVDVQGLKPLHTSEDVDRVRAQIAEFHAASERRHEERQGRQPT